MELTPPLIDTQTATDLLILGQRTALEVSKGKLSDITAGSPVTAILEANAVIGASVVAIANQLATVLETQRLQIFGLERQGAIASTGTIEVVLDGLYASPFYLPKGYAIAISGIEFQTIGDLTIPAYQGSGTISISATTLGTSGNLANTSLVTFGAIERVANIRLFEDTRGGQDGETDAEWKAKIYQILRRRDTLISESDFEEDVNDYLGKGSVAIAIGRLKPDKVSYANGYVSVFGLNPNGNPLNSAQIAQLQGYLHSKAAMATVSVFSVEIVKISIEVIASFSSSNPESLSLEIYNAIAAYLKPGNLKPGKPISNKAIEYRIGAIAGIEEGIYSIRINGFAQPYSLPNDWTVGAIAKFAEGAAGCKIILTDSVTSQVFTYQY